MTSNQMMPPLKQLDPIKVCIRLRPLLQPYEDEEVWGVDYKENKIITLPNAANMDPLQAMMSGSGPGQSPNLNALLREKELRRRYQDALQQQAY